MTSVLVAHSKYRFVPRHEGQVWPRLLGRLAPRFLRRRCRITEIEVHGSEIVKI